ncbi:hypothetical protein KGM_215347 [Danaus plexippus plexippus]|uniref:Uncharacterized protein n=1 Tax=Danaus plexippus plexippus TaxID=278856 RepID=A0A212F5F1_DANPL|nr:hypothetical protein KGM_215347 [Danaus plexippus plexippus]
MGMSKGLVVCSLLVAVFVVGVLATAVLQLVSAATEGGGQGSLECIPAGATPRRATRLRVGVPASDCALTLTPTPTLTHEL